MTEESPLARLLGIEAVSETSEKPVARLVVRDDHTTPTGVVRSGVILSLADSCATYMANRVNDDGPNSDAFMVLVGLHSSLLGNKSDGELVATSTVVRCGRRVTVLRTVVTGTDDRRLEEVTTTHIPA
tara:strand:+ start:78 stop:461 length:384 start_codon:yes stop_codon:yes gene_type:complete